MRVPFRVRHPIRNVQLLFITLEAEQVGAARQASWQPEAKRDMFYRVPRF